MKFKFFVGLFYFLLIGFVFYIGVKDCLVFHEYFGSLSGSLDEWENLTQDYDRKHYKGVSSESDVYLAYSYELYMNVSNDADIDDLCREITDKMYRSGGHIVSEIVLHNDSLIRKNDEPVNGSVNLLIEIPAERADSFIPYLYELGDVTYFYQNMKTGVDINNTSELKNEVIYSDIWIYIRQL